MNSVGHFRSYGEERRLSKSSIDLINQVASVTEEYEAKGFSLTVRQIHYQFVSRGWLPNTGKTYAAIQGAVNKGRLAGLISWTAIEDRGRSLKGVQTYESPSEILKIAKNSFKRDLWKNCQNGHCVFCSGALYLCVRCNGAEGTLPKECPGERISSEDQDAIMAGDLDFVRGRWWGKKHG